MLQSLDIAVFRLINKTLSNGVFDVLMPQFSDTPYFIPTLIVVLIALAAKGGVRGKICVAFVLLAICVGDGFICNTIKHAVNRARPFDTLDNVNLLLGKGGSGSMPSSHAANWFAATMVTFIFYRRSWWLLLPLACLVSFSRIYNGVHYPSDVLAGAILGAGYGAALVWGVDAIWKYIGKRWFPIWWEQLPSLMLAQTKPSTNSASRDDHWIRLGYLLILALLVTRLFYVHSNIIDLSEDEAYQWTWSKHLALSYYSKPPLIALTQFLSTHIWGDTHLGVRFFSPVIAAILSTILLRFFTKEVSARFAFALLVIMIATPLMAVGSTLMTIDPLSVLFWVAAMIIGWRAIQPTGTTRDWLFVGLWMGLGFLSKYTNLFQWLCWIIFFALYSPARVQLRKPGPYLALLVNALFFIPVIIWNSQHGWITIQHVANDGAIGKGWNPKILDFIAAEFVLLNPIFFITLLTGAVLWARAQRNTLNIFLFCMGAPVFVFYLLYSLHSRVLPNWIAPSVVPLFCLFGLYWRTHWQRPWVRKTFAVATAVGIFFVVITHDTNLIAKIAKRALPAKVDPLRRVRAWSLTAQRIAQVRRVSERNSGTPTFIIGDHYGITGELSFYIPEARVKTGGDRPLVYYIAKPQPENQFFFWPDYLSRKGENAIYVQQLEEPKLVEGWIPKWLMGDANLVRPNLPQPVTAPTLILKQFTTVKDLGIQRIEYRGRIFRHVQLFECRGLR